MKHWDIKNLSDQNWFPFDLRRVSESEYGEKLISIWLVLSAGTLAVATLLYLGGKALSAVIDWSHGLSEMWGWVPDFAAILSIILAAILVARRLCNFPIRGLKDRPQTALFLAGGILLIFLGAGMSVAGLILPGIVLVLIVSLTIPLPLKKEKEQGEWPRDWLHRRFFANRIARYLIEEDPPLHRIAVLGPWGEGKTRALELIEWETKRLFDEGRSQGSFRPKVVWINPWKATNKQEAWSVVAEGFKEIRSPMGKLLSSSGLKWLGAVFGLFGFESITKRVLEAIQSHFPDEAKHLLKEVDAEIERRGLRLFVFVDDMERADSEAIRGILPVIDRLSNISNCYFLFGIDRGRLEDAFLHLDREVAVVDPDGGDSGEQILPLKRSMTTVTGYLDKVMDIQFDLPTPDQREIIHFAKQWLNDFKGRCPKLRSAFEALAPSLPQNARRCEKFLKAATQTEILFLKEYGEKERNFEALFFVVLGEACFPGFQRFLAATTSEWPRIGDGVWSSSMADGEKDITQADKYKKFRTKVIQKLSVPSKDWSLLTGILVGVARRFGIAIAFTDQRSEDPEWVVSGYMAPRVLTFRLREAIMGAWLQSGGSRSFSKLLIDTEIIPVEEIPSDRPRAIAQTIEANLFEARRRLEDFRKSNSASEDLSCEVREVTQWLDCYAKYFGKGRLNLDDCDREILSIANEDRNRTSPAIIAWFEELVQALPIPRDADDWVGDLRRSRVEAFRHLVCCLRPADVRSITTNLLFPNTSWTPEETPREVKIEFREIATAGRAFLAALFIDEFPRRKWTDLFDMVSGTGRQMPLVLLEPNRWVPLSESSEMELDFFEDLQLNGEDPNLLRKNLYEIVAQIFLRPLAEPNANDHELGFRVQRLLCDPGSRARPYLAAFWRAAIRFLGVQEKSKLMELREMLLERAGGEEQSGDDRGSTEPLRMKQEFVEEAFPLGGDSEDPTS